MPIQTNLSEDKIRVTVKKTKAMLDSGYTVVEIANALGLNESTIRAYKKVIDEASKNRGE